MSDLSVPPATLSAIRGLLGAAAEGLEGTAGSAPRALDGGDMTPLLTAMLGRLVESAATMSEGLTAINARVDEAETGFWTTDAAVADTFRGGTGVH